MCVIVEYCEPKVAQDMPKLDRARGVSYRSGKAENANKGIRTGPPPSGVDPDPVLSFNATFTHSPVLLTVDGFGISH